jgi:hypothetical protein
MIAVAVGALIMMMRAATIVVVTAPSPDPGQEARPADGRQVSVRTTIVCIDGWWRRHANAARDHRHKAGGCSREKECRRG